MAEVVTVPAPAATPAPSGPIVETAAPAASAPVDRKAAAIAMLKEQNAARAEAEAKEGEAKPAGKVEAAPEDKPAEAAKPAEDPQERLHAAMSKLNKREAEIRQREGAYRQERERSKADAAELAELRALKAGLIERPRDTIRKLAGEDKEAEVFNKYVGQVAATPEQIAIEELKSELNRIKSEKAEAEKKSKEFEQSDHLAKVVREYSNGCAQQLQATPEKFQIANIAAATHEVFNLGQGRYGGVLDLAVAVADAHAIRAREVMTHAQALEVVERFLAERESTREAARQKFRKPEEAREETATPTKKTLAVPVKQRSVTVRHTLSNAMQGNAAAREHKPAKSLSREERLKMAMQSLRR